MDHLTRMLQEQLKFQHVLGYDFATMSDKDRIDYIKTMYIASVHELGEALNEIPWKPWSKRIHTNDAAFIGELSDAWQCMANMWFAMFPMSTPSEIAQAMHEALDVKLVINHARQNNGYDGSTKCPKCKRALDDADNVCDPESDYCAS